MKYQTSNYHFFFIWLFVLLPSCSLNYGRPFIQPSSITVHGNLFIDNYGRQVILNGINVVNKSKEDNYLYEGGPEFYSKLKSWGFNCVRFIIIWDGLEPKPGIYDEGYLQKIDQRIQWAGENGLFVVLDMHQDLFSVKYSDGAPEWATLDEGKPHVTGSIWSDAYMLSEAVQTSFDNFWANRKASDGIGLQDHYANLWQHLAERYTSNSTVIGYDLMNEPFPGSSALQATPDLLNAYAKLVFMKTGKMMTEDELMDTWGNSENRTTALKILSTKENYAQVFDALYKFNKEFETTHLQSMYQKVSNAIRAVDSTSILFLEHSYFSNTGVKSSIERVKLTDGSLDPLVAYAPHAYDLVTDTKDAAAAESERVAFIFDRIKDKADQLNMPVWLGEWGAYYQHGEAIVPVAQYGISLIEQNLFGHAYWSYNPGTENLAYFKEALLRPYPTYVNGNLLSYHFDHNLQQLNVEWQEDGISSWPTIIYIPWLSRLQKQNVKISIEKIDDSDAGWVTINPKPKGGKRTLLLLFNN